MASLLPHFEKKVGFLVEAAALHFIVLKVHLFVDDECRRTDIPFSLVVGGVRTIDENNVHIFYLSFC